MRTNGERTNYQDFTETREFSSQEDGEDAAGVAAEGRPHRPSGLRGRPHRPPSDPGMGRDGRGTGGPGAGSAGRGTGGNSVAKVQGWSVNWSVNSQVTRKAWHEPGSPPYRSGSGRRGSGAEALCWLATADGVAGGTGTAGGMGMPPAAPKSSRRISASVE